MTESENVQRTRLAIQLVSERRFDELRDIIHDDIVVDCPFQAFHAGPPIIGGGRFWSSMQIIPQTFEKFELKIYNLFDCPEQNAVVFEQSSKGIMLDDGRSFSNDYLMIFRFRDNKIILWREMFNPERMIRQMIPFLSAVTKP